MNRVGMFLVWLLTVSLGAFFVVYAVTARPDGWGLLAYLGVLAVGGCAYPKAWKAAIE